VQRSSAQLSASTLRIAPELAWQVVDDEGVVVDLPRRRLLGLSPTAAFVWARVGTASEEAIVAELAGAFEVDEATARADVSGFLALLRDRGFVVEP
jgi:hypothetical protein